MSTPLQLLEELENPFLHNKHNNEILQEILNTLDQCNQSVECMSHGALALSIKTSALKQKNENENFRMDGWKQYSLCSRPKTCANRNSLVCLLSIGMNNSEIAKIFHVHRNLVVRWKNEYDLNNALHDPSDDNEIIQYLEDTLNVCPNVGELHARGLLLSKGTKINQFRLCNLLKNLKESLPSNVNPIRRRLHQTCAANSM